MPSLNESVIILGRLGRGATSHVFRVQSTRTRKLYAMKVIDKKGARYDRASLQRELELQGGLSHPNVVQLIKHLEDSDNHYVLTEYCEQGEITRLILQKMPEKQLACLITQIAKGLQYLHDNGVAHCDLKLSNLLLHQGKIKLCDFGYSQRIPPRTNAQNSVVSEVQSSQIASTVETSNSQSTTQTLFGTLFYMAPEMLRSKQRVLFREADVWALGISILILVTQKQPYTGSNTRQIRQQILQNERSPIPPLSSELTALLQGLLNPNPQLRLTLPQILEHQFLKKYECEDINIQIRGQKDKYRSSEGKKTMKSQSEYEKSEQKSKRQLQIQMEESIMLEENDCQISKTDLGCERNDHIVQKTDKKYVSKAKEQQIIQQTKLEFSRKKKLQQNIIVHQSKKEQIKSLPCIQQTPASQKAKWRFKRVQTLPQSTQSTVDKRIQRAKAPDSQTTVKGRSLQLQKIDARLLNPLRQFFYRTRNDGYIRVHPNGMMEIRVKGLQFTIDKSGQSLCLGGRTFSLLQLKKYGKNGDRQQPYEFYEYALQLVKVISSKRYTRCWQENWKNRQVSVGLGFNGQIKAVGQREGEMFLLQLNADGLCDLNVGQKQSSKILPSELPADIQQLYTVLIQHLPKSS